MEFFNAWNVYRYLAIGCSAVEEEGQTPFFVLGSGSTLPAVRAAEEWHRSGRRTHIAFTSSGGTFGGNLIFGQEECDEYAEQLRLAGVPTQFLHYPAPGKRTTNTLEEARFALQFMEHALGTRPRRVALFARGVHMRRAWATFAKQWPNVEFTPVPDGEPATVEILPRLVDEIDRLQIYGKKGDLVPQEIPAQIIRETDKIRKFLGKSIPPELIDSVRDR